MPNPNISTAYPGNLSHSEFLSLMVLGNQAVQKGSVWIVEDERKTAYFPKLAVNANLIQEQKATPDDPSNAASYTELAVTPVDMMLYDRINPRQFDTIWRQFQGDGPKVDRIMNPQVQAALLREFQKSVNNQLGDLIWAGDNSLAATSPLRFFDGYITLAAADSDVIDVTNIGAITEANVVSILEDCRQAIPDAILDDPNLVIHMNTGDHTKYVDSQYNKANKGPADFEGNSITRFRGIEIRHYTGLPANSIIICISSTGSDSNLVGAVDAASDAENIIIQKWRSDSDLFFVKANFRMAVGLVFGAQTILYQGS